MIIENIYVSHCVLQVPFIDQQQIFIPGPLRAIARVQQDIQILQLTKSAVQSAGSINDTYDEEIGEVQGSPSYQPLSALTIPEEESDVYEDDFSPGEDNEEQYSEEFFNVEDRSEAATRSCGPPDQTQEMRRLGDRIVQLMG